MLPVKGKEPWEGWTHMPTPTKAEVDPNTLVSSAELAEIVGMDLETINNWIRRGIISRTPIGGRQLRNRLFSTDEVYKTALTSELVKLGIAPSSAHEVVNALWKEWDRKNLPEGGKFYAVLFPTDDKWMVAMCWQKQSGGPVYKAAKSTGNKSPQEMALPSKPFVMVPISDTLTKVRADISRLVAD
jgi:hypothetical protein